MLFRSRMKVRMIVRCLGNLLDCYFRKRGSYNLQEPPILMLPVEGRPLILYLTVLDNLMGYVLGHHDESGRKEHAIYYLSKKFTDCET